MINKIELANGNTENTNEIAIKTTMIQEQTLRHSDQPVPPLDHSFLTSVSQLRGHSWAGVGLGIDRLTMVLGGIPSIKDVQWV
jgi:elongation factor P--beta-lysine ligase